MSEMLKPCPFCGKQNAKPIMYGPEGLFAVNCECGAGVRGFDQCRQDAIAAWNGRCSADSAPATNSPSKLAQFYDAELANVTGQLFDALNEIKRLRTEPQASAESEPVAACVRLEAKAKNGEHDWVEIFPYQLEWIVAAGHQVRAIEIDTVPQTASSPAENYNLTNCLNGCANILDTIKGEWGDAWSEWDQAIRDSITKHLKEAYAARHSQAEIAEDDGPLKFADYVENIAASFDNPIKYGRFVRIVNRTGRLNAGKFVEYIDDRGETHLTPPDNIRRRDRTALSRPQRTGE